MAPTPPQRSILSPSLGAQGVSLEPFPESDLSGISGVQTPRLSHLRLRRSFLMYTFRLRLPTLTDGG